jgi:uncharacterized Zn finger protein (UPF0148 family)
VSPGAIEASCPSCGAPVAFKRGSSVVVVCEFCNSVVARGDRKLEDLGKVAELIETGSPLEVGLKGAYQGAPFELTGRAQLGHESGGLWDEWYAAFSDGRWGWLAEAQGRFYLTFQQDLPEQTLIPPIEMLGPGQAVAAIRTSVPLVVAETGEARALGAKGEIPYLLVPGELYYYADLSGPNGVFATLDYSQSPPMVFIGREVRLSELGFPASLTAPERAAQRVGAVQLSCPHCGGPLELRAPDRTERVACPNCGSLLDVASGRLELMQALKPPKVQPLIPIGATGELFGMKLMAIGFMQRSVEFEGVRYYWEEYLLYNPQVGFRWLVRSDDNWSFVESVPAGEVEENASRPPKKGDTARFRGERYKLYQHATARVELVLGEFYWKVTVGELGRATDYIHPPRMLSKEDSVVTKEPKKGSGRSPKSIKTGEVNWSLGTYLSPKQVEKAFGVKGIPRPSKVGWNQPFPYKKVYKYWLWLAAAVILLGVIFQATGARRVVLEQAYQLESRKSAEETQVLFIEGLELKSRQNIKIALSADVDNSWVYVEGDVIDEVTGDVQPFSVPVEYYHGVESGESWAEGSKQESVHLSAVTGGTYLLRLEAQWEKWQQPLTLNVRIEQGVPRLLHMLLALLVISIIPLIVAIKHLSFEKRRWEDSDFTPFGQ